MTETSKRTCLTIILAAGEGKRMASSMPKVIHPVAGLPMVCHVMETSNQAGGAATAVVVGNQAERVAAIISAHDAHAEIFEQTERKGTAHAVLSAREALKNKFDDVVILYGDVPLIRTQTLSHARNALAEGADVVVLGFETADPTGYGRLLVENGSLVAIREHKDASESERLVTFCNSGIMAFNGKHVESLLDAIGNENAQGEYYLPDAVEIARERGLTVTAIKVPEDETLGVNDRVQLAEVEEIWQKRKREEYLRAGVTMATPNTVQFHHDTKIENDVTLEPNIVFGPAVEIKRGATIKAFSHLEGANVGEGAVVGPFARLRPGTDLAEGTKVGNFVETKAARVEKGAKINHLSYVGDASVGEKANIGAGTITCNYDGYNKHKTTIGAGAFIGSNASLVAPVTIGANAITGAGSVISQDVGEDDLAVTRASQKNLKGKARVLHARNAELKAKKSK